MTEHRQHPRFRLLHTTARTEAFESPVLDLSRTGMRIQPPERLAVGTAMEFELDDGNHRLAVAGKVRWSGRATDSGDAPAHRAGVRFEHIHTSNARSIWARLVAESGETGLPVGHRPQADESAARVPLLNILTPEDGIVTRHDAVTVIGQVRDPGLGAMIEVNGVRALVYGRRFEARIPLLEGINFVSATVSTDLAPVCRSRPVQVTRASLTA